MGSTPEGGLSKRRQNRLTLKTALAALQIVNAVPTDVVAQSSQNVQQGISNTQPQEEDLELTDRVSRAFYAFKDWSRRGEADPEYSRILNETEPFIRDQRYIQGIKVLRQEGVTYPMFAIGRIPPQVLMDHENLRAKLQRVPQELRPHIELSVSDVMETRDYQQNGLQQLAEKTSSIGQKLWVDNLLELLRYDNDDPSASSRLIEVSQKSEKTLPILDLLELTRTGAISVSSFSNPAFVSGILQLSKAKIRPRQIVAEQPTDDTQRIVETLISDPQFIDSLLHLKSIGYSEFRALEWLPDLYRDPQAMKNAEFLQRTGVATMNSTEYKYVLPLQNLEETFSQVPESEKWLFMSAIKELRGDVNAWNSLHKGIGHHRSDPNVVHALLSMGLGRLKDPEYMGVFDRTVTNPPQDDVSQMLSRLFGGATFQRHADDAYIREKLGTDLKTLRGSLQSYLTQWANADRNSALFAILDSERRYALRAPILRMNQLHDDLAPNRRLDAVRDLDARTLFEVITVGGADAWLSTARLIYNGNGYTGSEAQNSFLARVKSEYGSLPSFFKVVTPDHKIFGTFLEFLSRNDILDSFLSDVGSPTEQQALLREYLFDASSGISDTQALTLSDLLNSTKAEPIRQFVFGELRGIQKKQSNLDKKSPKIASLLIADYFQGKTDVPEWARASVQEYGKYFPEIKELSEDKMFRQEDGIKRNVQVHFFYDDRGPDKPESTWDGHGSFRNFITSLGGSVTWNKEGVIQRVTVNRGYEVKDEGDYVVIRQMDGRTKREVVMYAIKPDRTDETVAKVGGQLLKEKNAPMATLRGHSFHAWKMIKELTPTVVMVNLGSCGGAKNISDVLAKAPEAQVMATRGVGTMLVNDVVIPSLNSALLREGGIQWAQFGAQMTAEFKKRGGLAQERWASYQMPDKNKIAHLIAALKALGK